MSNIRPIVVTHHALEQARRRFRDDRTDAEIGDEIAGQVALALDAGRVANNKPRTFRLYGETKRRLPPGLRCVWNEDASRAWIVASEQSEVVVLTSLSKPGFNGKKSTLPSAAPRPVDP